MLVCELGFKHAIQSSDSDGEYRCRSILEHIQCAFFVYVEFSLMESRLPSLNLGFRMFRSMDTSQRIENGSILQTEEWSQRLREH